MQSCYYYTSVLLLDLLYFFHRSLLRSSPHEKTFRYRTFLCLNISTCVCVFSSHPFWTSMDVPAGVTQEEGHTGFLIHLPSAVRALIFVARKIQPFLSLVDRELEFCVQRINRSPPVGHFYFGFLVFSEKNPVCRDRTHVPTCQKVTRCQLSYRGRPAITCNPAIIILLYLLRCARPVQISTPSK